MAVTGEIVRRPRGRMAFRRTPSNRGPGARQPAELGGYRRVDPRRFASQSDEQLVAQVRAGDDSAFEAIYDRYARGVLAFCGHMLGSRDEAEDALQLTFLSAYQALRGGDNGVSLRPWLYTIARNRCLSELRARPYAVQMDEAVVDRACLDGPGVQVQRRAELRDVVDEIKRLPAEQRAALVLFELGDHSHAEIAEVLGVGREKVKALIFQAREGLVRGREARDSSCAEVRERLATVRGKIPVRSTTRAHIDRCPSCKAFEHEVRRQRAALALILPVGLVGELKASVLSVVFTGGSGSVAAGAGASGGGGIVAAGAGASGSGVVLSSGAAAAGSGTAAVGGGAVGTVAAGAGAAGGLASAGTGAGGLAVASAAPVTAVATGLTAGGTELAVAGGVAGAGSTAVVAKIVAAAAIAGAVFGASHAAGPVPAPTTVVSGSPAIHRAPTASAASNLGAAKPPATPSSASTSGMTTGDARPNTPNPNTPESSTATNGSTTAAGANPSTGGSTSATTGGSSSAAGTSPATSGSTTAAGANPSTGGSTSATTGGSSSAAGTSPATSGSTTAAGANPSTGGSTSATTGGSSSAAGTSPATSGSTTAAGANPSTGGSTSATTGGSSTAAGTSPATNGSTTAAGTNPTTSTTTDSAQGVPEAQADQAQSDAAAPVEYAATQVGDEIAFIQASSVPTGPKQTLTDKLSAAHAALGAGDKKLAENDLDAALNYIDARSGKTIPTTTATQLIADITRIKAAIG